MSRRQILMLIGVWVALLAAPGFPAGTKSVLLVTTGVCIVFFGYRMPSPSGRVERDLPFSDHKKQSVPEEKPPAPPASTPVENTPLQSQENVVLS